LIEGGKDYFTSCYKNKGKTIISKSLFDEAMYLCREITQGRWTKSIFDQINHNNQENHSSDIEFIYQAKFIAPFSSYTTIPLDSSNSSTSFITQIKGMIDLLIINHKTKDIFIYDIKTTSSPLKDFNESFFKWGYNHQDGIYKYLINEIKNNDEYFKKFYIPMTTFIVASRQEKKVQLYNYCTSHSKYANWKDLIKEMYWHDHTKNYDYEFEVYKNDGVICITE